MEKKMKLALQAAQGFPLGEKINLSAYDAMLLRIPQKHREGACALFRVWEEGEVSRLDFHTPLEEYRKITCEITCREEALYMLTFEQ